MDRASASRDADRWLTLADTYSRIGDANEDLLVGIMDQIGSLRSQYRSRPGRLWMAEEAESIIGRLLTEGFEREQFGADVLFAIGESLKARMLLDQITGHFHKLSTQSDLLLGSRLEQEILHYSGTGDASLDELRLASRLPIVGRGMHRATRQERIDELESIYAAANRGFIGTENTASLEQVQAALRPEEAFIEYLLLDPASLWTSLAILVVTSESATRIVLSRDELPQTSVAARVWTDDKQPLDYGGIIAIVSGLRIAIANGNDAEAQAKLEILSSFLIEPLLRRNMLDGRHKRWIVAPDSVLHLVPWHALLDGNGRRLIDSRSLTLIPSASVWYQIASRGRNRPARYLGLGDPKFGAGRWRRLEQSGDEVREFARALTGWQTIVRTDSDASETTLREMAEGSGLLHVATHGDFPELDPLNNHAIILAADKTEDGRLTAAEIGDLALGSVGLAILSVCNGSVYRVGPGSEPYGLIAGLFRAGVENVVGSLWPLDDTFAKEFVVEFAHGILGNDPAEALRLTMLKFADVALLRDWAALSLIGSGRPVKWGHSAASI